MKNVALLGGSFNPPHPGHFEMGKYIYETLGVDEVWFLFSTNTHKDASGYESLDHRIRMGQLLAKNYPDLPFVMSDAQYKMDKHITSEVLSGLTEMFPDTQFTWVMGADSLAGVHTWEGHEEIFENYSVAIVDRPSYTKKALSRVAAKTFQHLKIDVAKDLITKPAGWCFLDNPHIDISSTDIRHDLKKKRTSFNNAFQNVAQYIYRHGLYQSLEEPVVPSYKND
jgi:nicotinate-nucleotide adenylyltransferase